MRANRQFGQEPEVSLFTIGSMRAIGSPDQMYRVLKAAFEAGINHIETSPEYGSAESFLGKGLKQLKDEGRVPPKGWLITSKLLPCIELSEGKKQLILILKRLGISKLNNLAVHGLNLPEHLKWAIDGDGARLFTWAKKKGLVNQIGFSSHGSFSLIEEALRSKRFRFCSLHLHLLNPENIPLALQALSAGMGVMAISPADKGGRLQDPSETLIKDCKPFIPLELAYRFLLAKGISTLTIGASQPEDLKIAKKLVNADGPLSQQEQQAINQLTTQREARLGKSLCNQCRQCLPCPQEVPIPDLLRLRNLLIGHDLEVFTRERYNLIGKAGHWHERKNASSCKGCEACLPRCPSNLPIPELLKETHLRLADKPRKRLWG